jgi:dienelactone hydrolase
MQDGQTATLDASWTAFGGVTWKSKLIVHADANGRVNLQGLESARVLWSMRPTGPHRRDAVAFLPPVRGTSRVHLTLRADGAPLARAVLVRRVTDVSVHMQPLTKSRDGFFGFFFSAAGAQRRPAVLALGGSEGGYGMIDLAGLLASHGHPTLALAYFRAPGLPSELRNIPLEYFARALRWMRRQPSVDPDRIVALGASRGGEAALLLASTFPNLLHGAIGLVPSSEVYPSPDGRSPAWTYHARSVSLAPIPVERINGPILTVGAGQDAVWPSDTYTQQIEQRLHEHRFAFPHERFLYADAGHDVGGAVPLLPQPDPVAVGGSPAASAAAKASIWPHILNYLRRGVPSAD